MDTLDQFDVPADERFLLGLIAGCCAVEPRDDELIDGLIEQLRIAQASRRDLLSIRESA